MDFQVQITGLDQLVAKLKQAPDIAAPILQRALSASQAILAKYTTKGIVPWRTGFLTQSFRAELTTGMLRWFPSPEGEKGALLARCGASGAQRQSSWYEAQPIS